MKLLFLLLFGMILNMSTVCANASYQTNTVFVKNTAPPVEKGQKQQKGKKLKKQPPKANSSRFGLVFMILGIVFLALAVTIAIVMLALFLSGTTGFVFAFLGFLLAFLLLGIIYLVWGLALINRNKNWDKDYR